MLYTEIQNCHVVFVRDSFHILWYSYRNDNMNYCKMQSFEILPHCPVGFGWSAFSISMNGILVFVYDHHHKKREKHKNARIVSYYAWIWQEIPEIILYSNINRWGNEKQRVKIEEEHQFSQRNRNKKIYKKLKGGFFYETE